MKNKVIIVEGAQGSGKGTITNILREQMPYTNLLRLSGTSDKSEKGLKKVFNIRRAELDMIRRSRGCDINFILDRSHLSESVYCNLGFKNYEFKVETQILNSMLNEIAKFYDVYVIILTTTESDYYTRLRRDKPNFLDLSFNAESSIRQQKEYGNVLKDIERDYPEINCNRVDTFNRDPYDIAYDIINAVNN